MFLIRDVASQVGVRQQGGSNMLSAETQSRDIISKGLLTTQEAFMMIELYAYLLFLLNVLI